VAIGEETEQRQIWTCCPIKR